MNASQDSIGSLKSEDLIRFYTQSTTTKHLNSIFLSKRPSRVHLNGLSGSSKALVASALYKLNGQNQLWIINDKEDAAYFLNDVENLLGQTRMEGHDKFTLFYPTSYKRPYQPEAIDNANVLLRTGVLESLRKKEKPLIVVSYPDALCEKVVTQQYLSTKILTLHENELVSLDFVTDVLMEYGFEREDFVVEPGQFAVRGGIVDVFSYASEFPYRIEFMGESVDSMRSFDPSSQLSKFKHTEITILPNVQNRIVQDVKASLLAHFPDDTLIFTEDLQYLIERIEQEFEKAVNAFEQLDTPIEHARPEELFSTGKTLFAEIQNFSVTDLSQNSILQNCEIVHYTTLPQPAFNKKFELLLTNLHENSVAGFNNLLVTENPKQVQRLEKILKELNSEDLALRYSTLILNLSGGFIDKDLKICCYTDHQIFERYHKFKLYDQSKNREILTLKDLYELKPGDFITHIDHGVGRFGGLEHIETNGKQQEAIRLIYKDNDILYVSIHSLHRISRYTGKEGTAPSLNRLGSPAWNALKNKTKQKVKDIAKDLIALYAKRKATKGFAYSADTYLQNELEASFIYEDTPDQYKATYDAKRDMESIAPMDRLVCGDVGFGKTEVAIRTAFKAVTDSKQVAVLVPTTILALQHYKTFRDRLKDFPCKIEYINRFRSTKEKNRVLKELEEGKVDILIGTHRIVSKDVKFKDLGLMIIDEEQKFGVGIKEKLKEIKVNIDTLTLTATPIPRTLQFSLMGARDLSIISTPPPNRYPVQTELHPFNEEVIRDAIIYELSRGGQVYIVHNRVQNINEIAGLIQRIVPDARVCIGHGQMEGHKLEEVMLGFIEGEFDILIATTIIENGLDIPNANTIIINEAQNYGLSDLHQLRGRVGRSNRKSFCYLLAPPPYLLSDEARKRLKAIEEFSDIGSGFNIAMRDLDIRGAGNILGGEQSGFISEIGYDMYHKILDEAIRELKETEFRELYAEELENEEFAVKECQIETDLEILIPDYYISNIRERLSLYKELDNLETDRELEAFQSRLTDRFGAIPEQTINLVNTIRLRRCAKETGLEKIILKQEKLIGYFVPNNESPYFQSERFGKVIQYLQQNPKTCRMREQNNKLSVVFDKVKTVDEALEILRSISK